MLQDGGDKIKGEQENWAAVAANSIITNNIHASIKQQTAESQRSSEDDFTADL